MLLVIDVGNTNTVLGVFDEKNLIHSWRIRSDKNMTEDEFNVLVSSLFNERKLDITGFRGTIISCVVPRMMMILNAFCLKYMHHPPIWVDASTVSSIMPILYSNPSEVGADRIVNAIAAYSRYKAALIVIDFGTATTFDVISRKGEYLGGAISPGIMISSDALFLNASKLPRVEIFSPPDKVIGKDTAESMKSGIIFGYAGLVDGMVARIKKELDEKPLIIATGGLAPLMNHVSESIEHVDSSLTLEGLRIIYDHLHDK
ncbi:MAG: type III pantothenate kinase [Proteobacteria bacterium]|nr:type III pantothenate kinase [Pseudomonadota bacterium]